MAILRVIIILVFSFVVTFVSLNFGLFASYLQFDESQNALIDIGADIQNAANVDGDGYLYPLSPDITGAPTIAPIPPATAPAIDNNTSQSGYTLELTTLGVSAPVVFESSTDIDIILDSLENGAVHFASTPKPGEWGTSVILGHSSRPRGYDGDYAYVFSRLESLNDGDIFRIYKDGSPMTFKISKKLIFSPGTPDEDMLRDFEKPNGASVILMTCWPTGTASQRIAVRAELL